MAPVLLGTQALLLWTANERRLSERVQRLLARRHAARRPAPRPAGRRRRDLLASALSRVGALDETTAEAGSTGARQLDAAAGAALRGCTGLVIAHRLTAVAADRVVVLDTGGGRARHPRATLAAGGGYAELWAAWSASR